MFSVSPKSSPQTDPATRIHCELCTALRKPGGQRVTDVAVLVQKALMIQTLLKLVWRPTTNHHPQLRQNSLVLSWLRISTLYCHIPVLNLRHIIWRQRHMSSGKLAQERTQRVLLDLAAQPGNGQQLVL